MFQYSIINTFEILGKFLAQFGEENFIENHDIKDLNTKHWDNFSHIIEKTELKNPWFAPAFIRKTFQTWGQLLTKGNLETWIAPYSFPEKNISPKAIGVIMAGNLPLVGFHDFLSVLITGHILKAKLSSKDDVLLPAIKNVVNDIDPKTGSRIIFIEDYLKNIDAAIATGSDNSSRYFEYYFRNIPGIIRKNRNSIAILTGDEDEQSLRLLADDVFLYFGLGCRNVSKIYLPEGYSPARLLENFEHYNHLANHNKFANNHDYQKAILLVNQIEFLDNNFLILREEKSLSSPVACVNYEYYTDLQKLKKEIENHNDQIQCIISASENIENKVFFGKSQFPQLNEYADNVDTIDFLLNLYT